MAQTAEDIAKAIKAERDRRERYRQEHGRVAVEQVAAVRQAVETLVGKIQADLPDISIEDRGRAHRLSASGLAYLEADYESP